MRTQFDVDQPRARSRDRSSAPRSTPAWATTSTRSRPEKFKKSRDADQHRRPDPTAVADPGDRSPARGQPLQLSHRSAGTARAPSTRSALLGVICRACTDRSRGSCCGPRCFRSGRWRARSMRSSPAHPLGRGGDRRRQPDARGRQAGPRAAPGARALRAPRGVSGHAERPPGRRLRGRARPRDRRRDGDARRAPRAELGAGRRARPRAARRSRGSRDGVRLRRRPVGLERRRRGSLDRPRRAVRRGRCAAELDGAPRRRPRRDGRTGRPGRRSGTRAASTPAAKPATWTSCCCALVDDDLLTDRSGAAARRSAARRLPARPPGGDGARGRGTCDRRSLRAASRPASSPSVGRAWAALPGRAARDVAGRADPSPAQDAPARPRGGRARRAAGPAAGPPARGAGPAGGRAFHRARPRRRARRRRRRSSAPARSIWRRSPPATTASTSTATATTTPPRCRHRRRRSSPCSSTPSPRRPAKTGGRRRCRSGGARGGAGGARRDAPAVDGRAVPDAGATPRRRAARHRVAGRPPRARGSVAGPLRSRAGRAAARGLRRDRGGGARRPSRRGAGRRRLRPQRRAGRSHGPPADPRARAGAVALERTGRRSGRPWARAGGRSGDARRARVARGDGGERRARDRPLAARARPIRDGAARRGAAAGRLEPAAPARPLGVLARRRSPTWRFCRASWSTGSSSRPPAGGCRWRCAAAAPPGPPSPAGAARPACRAWSRSATATSSTPSISRRQTPAPICAIMSGCSRSGRRPTRRLTATDAASRRSSRSSTTRRHRHPRRGSRRSPRPAARRRSPAGGPSSSSARPPARTRCSPTRSSPQWPRRRRTGEIDGWFFLRYLDGPGERPHLRLRVHAA